MEVKEMGEKVKITVTVGRNLVKELDLKAKAR